MSSDWRSEVSIIGPSTMARINGAPSQPSRRKTNPATPKMSMMTISVVLEFRIFRDEERSGLDAVNHQCAHKQRHDRAGGNAERKQRNERSRRCGIVRRF